MSIRKRSEFGILCLIGASLLAALPAPARQTSAMAGPAGQKAGLALTLESVQSVLGVPKDDISGAAEFGLGLNGEAVINYHYYDVDQDNYETDFASEIAPRMQLLYKKIKDLDRVRFKISMNDPATPLLWEPFSEFSMDRKTLEKLQWTWFVTRDILDQVLKNEK
jgi:hypothetical protein